MGFRQLLNSLTAPYKRVLNVVSIEWSLLPVANNVVAPCTKRALLLGRSATSWATVLWDRSAAPTDGSTTWQYYTVLVIWHATTVDAQCNHLNCVVSFYGT